MSDADRLLARPTPTKEIKMTATRTQSLLVAADLFYDLADEMKERLLEALRDSGIDSSRAERSKGAPLWFTVSVKISEVEDVHARVVLKVLVEEYRRYRRLADELVASL